MPVPVRSFVALVPPDCRSDPLTTMESESAVAVFAAIQIRPPELVSTPPELMVSVVLQTKTPPDCWNVPVRETAPKMELEPPVWTKKVPVLKVPPIKAIDPPEFVTAELPDKVKVPDKFKAPPDTVRVAAAPVPVAPILMEVPTAEPLEMIG